jgi:hypothetical protein
LRLVLDVEVHDGNQTAAKHGAAGLWALLDRLGRDCWPSLLRGDTGWATKPSCARPNSAICPICSASA